jgi:hypothetical protein
MPHKRDVNEAGADAATVGHDALLTLLGSDIELLPGRFARNADALTGRSTSVKR